MAVGQAFSAQCAVMALPLHFFRPRSLYWSFHTFGHPVLRISPTLYGWTCRWITRILRTAVFIVLYLERRRRGAYNATRICAQSTYRLRESRNHSLGYIDIIWNFPPILAFLDSRIRQESRIETTAIVEQNPCKPKLDQVPIASTNYSIRFLPQKTFVS